MTKTANELLAYFNNQKEDFVSLLESLVKTETPSDVPESFDPLWELLTDEFERLNYEVTHLKGDQTAGQLLCKPMPYNPEKAQQLIIGHADTVWDIGTLDEMPFKVEDQNIFGPGSYDMKAGLCMMIFALRGLKHFEFKPELQPVFLINSDEEIGSQESESLIIKEAKKSARTFVLEPALGTEGKIKTRRKGIGEFEITVKGKPSHAGLDPDKGVSAILGLSHIVQQLFKLNEPEKGITVNVGTIEGGERANVVAAQSKAVVDVRIPTSAEGERVKNAIYNLQPEIDGIELEVTGDIRRPPLEKEKANQQLWKVLQKLASELDLQLEEGISGGASDGNLTNQFSPTLDGLGPVGEGAHAYHEKIFLDKTIERLALLTLLINYPSVS